MSCQVTAPMPRCPPPAGRGPRVGSGGAQLADRAWGRCRASRGVWHVRPGDSVIELPPSPNSGSQARGGVQGQRRQVPRIWRGAPLFCRSGGGFVGAAREILPAGSGLVAPSPTTLHPPCLSRAEWPCNHVEATGPGDCPGAGGALCPPYPRTPPSRRRKLWALLISGCNLPPLNNPQMASSSDGWVADGSRDYGTPEGWQAQPRGGTSFLGHGGSQAGNWGECLPFPSVALIPPGQVYGNFQHPVGASGEDVLTTDTVSPYMEEETLKADRPPQAVAQGQRTGAARCLTQVRRAQLTPPVTPTLPSRPCPQVTP